MVRFTSYIDAIRVIMPCFVEEAAGVNTDRFTMMSESSMDHPRSILESLETICMRLMCDLNQYMVRSTLLQVAGGRQTAEVPKCKLLIFR